MTPMQMLIMNGSVPGVPAMGHMANGFWHPGSRDNCHKGGCDKDREK
jgi:hypothetical protein